MNFVFNQFIKDKFIIVNHSLNLLFFWTFFHCVQCTVCCFLWTIIIHYFRFYIHVFRWVNNFFRNIIIHATFCFVIFVCECYSLLFIKCKFRTIALFTSQIVKTWTRSIFVFIETWPAFSTNLNICRMLFYECQAWVIMTWTRSFRIYSFQFVFRNCF